MINSGFGFLFEMGCGKTLTAIAVAGALYEMGKIKRTLVVAPASVCGVWPEEFQNFAEFRHTAVILTGEKKRRIETLRELEKLPEDRLKIAVINYESTFRDGIFEELTRFAPDLIICDESQRIKTHNAAQSKAMHSLGDMARYKIILSGTPVQNNVVDLWSQYRFLDKSVFGTNFYAFKNKYCVMGGYSNHQITGYRYMDDLIKKEHSIAYRVTKDECLDLPEQTFQNLYVDFNKKERAFYDSVRRAGIAELEGGKTITAATVITKLLRLQQITGGFISSDENRKPERVNTAKLDALEDILDDYVITAGKKLVIFARFRAEIDAIEKLLKNKEIKYGCIYGDVPLKERSGIVNGFQNYPETKVFLAQLQTAGLGITLHAASAAVFYSMDFNYANYTQATARIHRIGQKHPCTYIHLMVKNTIDDKVLKAIQNKDDMAKSVVDNWRSYFE